MIGDKISGKDGKVKYGAAVNISSAVHANGVVTVNTAAAHGLSTGDRVIISGIVGMTDLNRSFTCTVTDTDTFTVVLTTAQVYTSGGSVQRCIEITKFSITKTAETQDTTDSSDAASGWKSNIPNGWKNWQGDFEGFLYAGTKVPAEGTEIDGVFEVNPFIKYSGKAILNSEATSLGVVGTEAVKVAYQFIGDGQLSPADTTV